MTNKIIFILILLTASCSDPKQATSSDPKQFQEEFLKNVRTAKSEAVNHRSDVTVTGIVTADPDRTVNYAPMVSGVIDRTYFALGDHVAKGQLMLDLRSTELSALQSDLTVAQRNLETIEKLLENKLSTERELVVARAQYEKIQNDLKLYGENRGGGVFAIDSPASGYVITKNGSAGSTVTPESPPLFAIADLSSVWVMANVYAGNLQKVNEGQSVEITAIAYPNEVFHGKINVLSQVFDPADRTLKARIVMPNPSLKLKPDMSVTVKIINQSDIPTTAIPSKALIFDDNRYFVVVRHGDNFEIRNVTPAETFDQNTYITDGLKPGEEVVVKDQLLIYNSLK